MFEINDRVFHIQYGWGEVHDTSKTGIFYVKFDNGNSCAFSTLLQPLLSYTEYTLEGFTLEKPKPSWWSVNQEWVNAGVTEHFMDFLERNFEPPVRKCK